MSEGESGIVEVRERELYLVGGHEEGKLTSVDLNWLGLGTKTGDHEERLRIDSMPRLET